MKIITIKPVLILFLEVISQNSHSQNVDSTQATRNFSGNVSVTNNGFSNIPTFSLGRPAIIFNIVAAGKRTSFEPEIRFSMERSHGRFYFG